MLSSRAFSSRSSRMSLSVGLSLTVARVLMLLALSAAGEGGGGREGGREGKGRGGKRREGEEREEKGREGKGREGKGREGEGRGGTDQGTRSIMRNNYGLGGVSPLALVGYPAITVTTTVYTARVGYHCVHSQGWLPLCTELGLVGCQKGTYRISRIMNS